MEATKPTEKSTPDELAPLRELVTALVSIEESDGAADKARVEILQAIGEMLLREYHIKIGDGFTVEPLWVEGYYYHKGRFEDGSTFQKPKQKDRFGKLYFHDSAPGGIDICLSDADLCGDGYYLSFLIKYSLVRKSEEKEPQFKIQTALYCTLKDCLKKDGGLAERVVLRKNPSKDEQPLFRLARKGLEPVWKKEADPQRKKERERYLHEELAIVKGLNRYSFYWDKGRGKMQTIASYLYRHPCDDPAKWCEEYLGRTDLTNEILKKYRELLANES